MQNAIYCRSGGLGRRCLPFFHLGHGAPGRRRIISMSFPAVITARLSPDAAKAQKYAEFAPLTIMLTGRQVRTGKRQAMFPVL